MPTPKFVGDTKSKKWKQQRGTSFGSSREGLDNVELKYRGPTDTTGNFIKDWPKGTACPIKDFKHCVLVKAPSVKEDEYGYSTAVLRFEGIEQQSSEGQVNQEQETTAPEYSYTGNWLSFRIDKFPNNEKEMPSWYSYIGGQLTVRYTSNVRPTENNLKGKTNAASYLPVPKPLKKDSGEGPKANLLKLNKDYVQTTPDGSFSYTEVGNVFSVTETWETFLQSNL